MRNKMMAAMGLAGMLGAVGYGSEVAAQTGLQIGGRSANYGTHSLRAGFVPDPRRINVVSGGGIDARTLGLGPGCVGWVTARPDAIVRLTGNSPNLRMYAIASDGTDVTLLVNTAGGQWRCNDDSFGGTNPTVELANATPGQYDVWVGSYRRGQQARAVLHITELANNHP